MKLQDIISEYIIKQGISVREFSRRTGLSNSYISNIVNGSNDNPSIEAFTSISKAMHVTKKELFDALDDDQMFEIKKQADTVKIPLYSLISCGKGIFIEDDIEDYITVPDKFLRKGAEYFANTAKGDSMIGKGIKENDILVFEKNCVLENGEIGSFCIGESEAVCKIFRKLSSGIILLESANDKYSPIEIDITNECFRIVGKYKFKFSVEQ